MHIGKTILLAAVFPLFAFAFSVAQKYPSYTYVFSEFGVDRSYVEDEGFVRFVVAHEEQIKRFYRHAFQNGKNLLPMMRGYLLEDGLSDLFVYLSMVESGFSSSAISSKNAAGLWQFIPMTAKQYDLEVHRDFDERYDPVSSTNAAIAYLQELHQRFGKWYLAALAYNCGEGRLADAIQRAGSDALPVLLDAREKYLPLETREYLQKILLAAMIGEGLAMEFSSSGEDLFEVEVQGGMQLGRLAKLLELDQNELLNLNPQFKKGVVPSDKFTYRVTIPEEKMILFYLRCEPPEKTTPIKPFMLSHTVVLGETLEQIAEKYETDAEEIKIVNRLSEEYLSVGQFLVIPVTHKVFASYSHKE